MKEYLKISFPSELKIYTYLLFLLQEYLDLYLQHKIQKHLIKKKASWVI